MTEIYVIKSSQIKSIHTFRIGVQFKLNWINWYAEILVTRIEFENHIDYTHDFLNESELPELTEADKKDLFSVIEADIEADVN